jgi:2'-5' RNA ligase
MSSKRLFVAVVFDDQVNELAARVIGELRERTNGAFKINWAPKGNLHVTLRFLGATPEEKMEEVSNSIAALAKSATELELFARGIGAFPDEKKPHSIWIGIKDQSNRLAELAGRMEEQMRALGFAPEARTFSPHLTLGRVKNGYGISEYLDPYRGVDFGKTVVSELVLFESITNPGGAIYRPVSRANFEKARN